MRLKKLSLRLLPGIAFYLSAVSARAEFLFNSYLTPSFQTQYSAWDVFYSPSDYANYPDFAAPYGVYGTAPAGYTVPPNANPASPSAYWDTRNATITQTGTSSAFIVSPGVSGGGNIYSFAAPTAYQLANSSAAGFGTVNFQFQTDGTLVDFSAIRLQYTSGSGTLVSLAPTEFLREYRASGSSFGGLTNRNALQWNLTGLNVTSYQVVFQALGSSNSLQQAVLDTAVTYGGIVPASRAWSAAGTGNWANGTNWQQGTTSVENGNVRFVNTAATTANLDANHTVGELRFDTTADATINSPGGFVLTANTGVTTLAAATGVYAINSAYTMNAFNVFDLAAGTVQLNGVVSGTYGFQKDGEGTLVLAGNNTFTGSVNVGGGTLRLGGNNAYTGSTSVVNGRLVVGADGALGNASTNVNVGADSALFSFTGAASAALVLDGARTLARNVSLANGGYEKRLAATNAGAGATFAGAVNFGTADNVKLTATAAADRLTFSGAMSGGAATAAVTVDGAGTVVFSGATKTYANATAVSGGMLQIAAGTSFIGAGAMSVNNGAALRVDGTLGGGGTLTLNAGVLTGNGTVGRTFTVGAGAILAPGNGVGTLNTAGETWAGGGTYRLELNSAIPGGGGGGQDFVNIAGSLSLTASAANRFTLRLATLTAAGAAGSLSGFDPGGSYSWRIAAASDGISGFDPAEFLVDRSGFASAAPGVFSVSQSGNDLYLNYTAVPEPSTWVLAGVGATALLWARCRRRADHPA